MRVRGLNDENRVSRDKTYSFRRCDLQRISIEMDQLATSTTPVPERSLRSSLARAFRNCSSLFWVVAASRFGVLILAFLSVSLAFASPPQTLSTVTDYSMPTPGQVTVPAKGGINFQMKVNGQGPFATVFDTGAVNVIGANFAQQLGLRAEEKFVEVGAIGGGVKAKTVQIDTLAIGDLIIHNQSFFVLDIPSGQGIPQMLVGWEILQSFAVRMDFQHNELTFFDLSHFTYQNNGAAIPLILNKHGNGIYFDAKVDGVKGRFQLDSGNEGYLFINSGFVSRHHLQQKLHATLRSYNGRGLGGDSPEAWIVRTPTLDIGGIILHDPIVRLQTASDTYLQELAGNIGQTILKHFTVTVDCRHHVMYLEKRPDWDAREIFNRAGFVYDDQEDGDEVKTIFPGSPAEAVGLKRGDLITAVNGAKPADNLHDPAFLQPVGTTVNLTVRRDGVELTFDLTLRDVL